MSGRRNHATACGGGFGGREKTSLSEDIQAVPDDCCGVRRGGARPRHRTGEGRREGAWGCPRPSRLGRSGASPLWKPGTTRRQTQSGAWSCAIRNQVHAHASPSASIAVEK